MRRPRHARAHALHCEIRRSTVRFSTGGQPSRSRASCPRWRSAPRIMPPPSRNGKLRTGPLKQHARLRHSTGHEGAIQPRERRRRDHVHVVDNCAHCATLPFCMPPTSVSTGDEPSAGCCQAILPVNVAIVGFQLPARRGDQEFLGRPLPVQICLQVLAARRAAETELAN